MESSHNSLISGGTLTLCVEVVRMGRQGIVIALPGRHPFGAILLLLDTWLLCGFSGEKSLNSVASVSNLTLWVEERECSDKVTTGLAGKPPW